MALPAWKLQSEDMSKICHCELHHMDQTKLRTCLYTLVHSSKKILHARLITEKFDLHPRSLSGCHTSLNRRPSVESVCPSFQVPFLAGRSGHAGRAPGSDPNTLEKESKSRDRGTSYDWNKAKEVVKTLRL